MNRVKKLLFERIICENLTPNEFNLILYLVKVSDEQGQANGVFYKDVSNIFGNCFQSFYNALRGLGDKDFVSCTHTENGYDVTVVGNSFVTGNGAVEWKDYIDINLNIFDKDTSKQFYSLRVGAKRVALEIIRRVASKDGIRQTQGGKGKSNVRRLWFNSKNLLSSIAAKVGITERMVRDYLKDLKKWIQVGYEVGTGEDGTVPGRKYAVVYVHKYALEKPRVISTNGGKVDAKREKYNEYEMYELHIMSFCRANDIHIDTAVSSGKLNLNDTVVLVGQYYKKFLSFGKRSIDVILKSILKTKRNFLDSKAVHKTLTDYLHSEAFTANPT